MKRLFLVSALLSLILSCSKSDDSVTPEINNETNILLIIADDLGHDPINGFTEGSIKANTPNLDKLISEGLVFNNFWTNSVCSPTRASILTGKYGYRTGVRSQSDAISASETSLQSFINQSTSNKYATAIVGKWHLSGGNSSFNPESMGIDYYAGLISGAVPDYYAWNLTEDGITTTENEYVTTKFTNLAIDWVADQSKPWFLWLAYNAPHTPFHAPPQEMHSQGSLAADQASIDADPTKYYIASIEAMDFQMGRLLNSLDETTRENTVVVFMGDNGSPARVSQSPYGRGRSKGSMYQGGINSPLIISGKGINRTGTDHALLNSTDLFATIAAMTGVSNTDQFDSKDFSSLFTTEDDQLREFTYAEYYDGTSDEWTIRNAQYKLIRNTDSSIELYKLTTDPYENDNLMLNTLSIEAQTAKNLLEAKASEIRQ